MNRNRFLSVRNGALGGQFFLCLFVHLLARSFLVLSRPTQMQTKSIIKRILFALQMFDMVFYVNIRMSIVWQKHN